MNFVFRGALVASAALAVAACGQQNEPDAVGSVQGAASNPVGQTSAAVMGADMVGAYVPNAAMGDMYEIRSADIALERTQNAQIRELAQMIKTDHTAAEAMKPLAAQAAPGVEIPTKLDERRQGLIENPALRQPKPSTEPGSISKSPLIRKL